MTFLAAFMPDTLTYWAPPTPDGNGGMSFASPLTFRGKWEERKQVLTDDSGREFVSRARVFCEQEVAPLGWLFLGTDVSTDPQSAGGFEIRDVEKQRGIAFNDEEIVAFL